MKRVRLFSLLLGCAALLALGLNWRLIRSSQTKAAGIIAGTAPRWPGLKKGDDASASSAMQRMLAGEFPRLTSEQIAAYVESRHGSVSSLIAAWNMSQDEAWLREAEENHPNDPRVAAAMIARYGVNAETARWIENLKRHDPDCALGPLYAAKAALNENRTADAIEELKALNARSRMDLRTDEAREAIADAYHSAGYEGLEAEWAAFAQTPVPLSDMHTLSKSLAGAMTAASENGDREQATQIGELAMKAAATVSTRGEDDLLVAQLVRVSMERQVLNQMDGFDLVPGYRKIVVERLSEMDKRITGIKELLSKSQSLLPTLTDSEARQYTRRVQVDGELKAMQWLVSSRRSK